MKFLFLKLDKLNKQVDLAELDSELTQIKTELDCLLTELGHTRKSYKMNYSTLNDSTTSDDLNLLIETYEQCAKQFADLSDKTKLKGRFSSYLHIQFSESAKIITRIYLLKIT